MVELLICPGIDKLYAVAVATPDGGFERVSEHDTPTQALDARDNARSAANRTRSTSCSNRICNCSARCKG